MTGVVTAIIRKNLAMNKNGGFGFIRDEQNQERFFHAHNLQNVSFEKLREGAKVTFTPLNIGGKGNGLRAEDVTVDAA